MKYSFASRTCLVVSLLAAALGGCSMGDDASGWDVDISNAAVSGEKVIPASTETTKATGITRWILDEVESPGVTRVIGVAGDVARVRAELKVETDPDSGDLSLLCTFPSPSEGYVRLGAHKQVVDQRDDLARSAEFQGLQRDVLAGEDENTETERATDTPVLSAGDRHGVVREALGASGIEAHPQPAYLERSPDFSVKVNGTPVDVISGMNGYDYCHFSMGTSPVTIEVTVKSLTTISQYNISPFKQAFQNAIVGNKITYTLPSQQYSIVNVAGKDRLIVLADPEPTTPASSAACTFNVVSKYGADASGNQFATTAIQQAINDASASGCAPATVYVPPGKFKVGNLTLKSNADLYMEGGSAFWFTGRPEDYRLDWTTKGNGTRWITTAPGASNIHIYGRGTFDGNAAGAISNKFGNNILVLDNASNVQVSGVILRASTKWGTIVAKSDNSAFRNVKFFNHLNGGENDAIDVVESQKIYVKSSIAVSFDDPFSVKSYGDNCGSGCTPSNYTTFSGPHEPSMNNTFEYDIAWTGCHAFKVGAGMGSGHDTITFKNSVVYDAATAINLQSVAGFGPVNNITWENIDIERIKRNNQGQSWARLLVDQNGSSAKGLYITSINVRDPGADMSPLQGYSDAKSISDVVFKTIKINGEYAHSPADARLAVGGFVKNLAVTSDKP